MKTPFAILAADHGQPLVDMLDAHGLPSGPDAQRAFKADLVETVGRDAGAVLLDPDVSLPDLSDRVETELLVRIEADDYDTVDGARHMRLLAGGERVRELGGDVAKLMVYLRADRDDGHAAQLVRDALADCDRAAVECVVELMTYRLEDESVEAFAARREDLIAEGALLLEECGAPVLKLEYPGSAAGCRRVSDALSVPWAVLSAGVDHDAFCGQLRDAMDGGAAGFIAGRSLWKEAVGLPAAERREFLEGVGRRRLAEMLAIVG
jgi:tagatose 1,6-diphosphate aldolase